MTLNGIFLPQLLTPAAFKGKWAILGLDNYALKGEHSEVFRYPDLLACRKDVEVLIANGYANEQPKPSS